MSLELRHGFSLSIVNGSNIEYFLKGLKPIDVQGMDSLPFKIDDWMVKRYFRQPLEIISLYQYITNEMASHANSYSVNIRGLGRTQLKVEPVAKVLQSDQTGLVYGISRFAYGKRGVDGKITELAELLDQFTLDMKQRIGLRGIHVIASNTKLKPGLVPFNGSTCNITDVCASIGELATGHS